MWKLGHMRRSMLAPCAAKDVEGIGCHTADAMVRRPHNEFCAGRNRAELSNDELVTKLRIVEKNIVFLKSGRVIFIVVVGVVSYKNIRCFNNIFYKA